MKAMSKKTIIIICFFGVILIAILFVLIGSSLSSKKETEWKPKKIKPIADSIEKTKPDLDPDFLTNVDFGNEFSQKALIADFSYPFLAFGNDDVVYLYNSLDFSDGTGFMHVIDMKSGNMYPLCSDKDCNHESKNCTSYMPDEILGNDIYAMFSYEKSIYTVGFDLLSNRFKLSSMSLDGSDKKTICYITHELTVEEYRPNFYGNSVVISDDYLYYTICKEYKNNSRVYSLQRCKLDGSETHSELYSYTEEFNFYLHDNQIYIIIPDYSDEASDEILFLDIETLEAYDVSETMDKIWRSPYIVGEIILDSNIVSDENGLYLLFYEDEINYTYEEDDMGYFLYDIKANTTTILDMNTLSANVKKDLIKGYGIISDGLLTDKYVGIVGYERMYIFDHQWNHLDSISNKYSFLGNFNGYTMYYTAANELYLYDLSDTENPKSIYLGEFIKENDKYQRNYVTNIYDKK